MSDPLTTAEEGAKEPGRHVHTWIGDDCPEGWEWVGSIDVADPADIATARDKQRRIGAIYDGRSGSVAEPCCADTYARTKLGQRAEDLRWDVENLKDDVKFWEARAATAEAEVERLLRERQLCDARIHNQRAVLRDWGPGVRAEKTADFVVKTIALIRKKSKALRAAESEASVLRERVARLEHGLETIGFLYDGRPRDGSNLVDDFPAWARQALKDGRNVE